MTFPTSASATDVAGPAAKSSEASDAPPALSVRVVGKVSEIPRDTWEALRPAKDPLWTRGLFEAMETGGLGPDRYDYLVAESAGRIVAILPTFWFAGLDLGDVLGAQGRRLLAPLRRMAPGACRIRVLFAGNLLGEGHVLAEPEFADLVRDVLLDALMNLAGARRTHWIVCKDFPDGQLARLRPALRSRGFFEVPALPDAVLPVRWSSFEDYVTALRAKPRRNTRNKLRRLEHRSDLRMEIVSDFTGLTSAMLPLYHQVLARAESRLDVWTESFLRGLSHADDLTTSVVACWQDDRLVGFLLCVFDSRNGVALRVGLDYAVAGEAALYHNLHYAGIELSIARGCGEFGFSQTAYEPKLEMGCRLTQLEHAVTHSNPLIRAILRRTLPAALSSAQAVTGRSGLESPVDSARAESVSDRRTGLS